MAAISKRTRLPAEDDSPKASHVCQLCSRSYDRADHLTRHLDSHRNERTFRCSDCPRGFNRRDLLLRHQATHSKNAANGKVGPDRANERAIKACDSCVISKLKCDNSRPCQRCRKRKIECRTGPLNKASSAPTPSSLGDGQSPIQETRQSLLSPPETDTGAAGTRYDEHNQAPMHVDNGLGFDTSTLPQLPSENDPTEWDMGSLLPFPSFFEQIMAPDFVASDSLSMPPDIFNMVPDQERLPESSDIFGVDFTPTIDFALESQINNYPFPEQQLNVSTEIETTSSDAATGSARERHAIFLRSPWLWHPEANQNAFSEHSSIPLDERQIDMGASPHQPYMHSLVMQDTLSPQSRDRIFQLVVKTAKSHVSIPSFPSTKCLNILLKVGIAKRMETDAWIHPYTFVSGNTRPELLAALIAAGCVCFGIPSVSKTGLVMFEIVRVALNRLIEDDNSVIRDLQYLQACMIWIDITAFCGFKRKMEIAESSLQPLVTALRRAGKFDRVAYSQIVPEKEDEGEELERKWRLWVEQESYKRLVYHLFEHDIYTTIAKVRNPLISYAELSLPLPSCRELWLSPSPEIWQLSFTGPPELKTTLSLRDLLSNNDLLRCLPLQVDASVARTSHLYGLAAQTWELHQQSTLLKSTPNEDPSVALWHQSHHQRLYTELQSTWTQQPTFSPVTSLFASFLCMTLHISPDTITRFAGKCGEAEAHRAFTELQSWVKTKQARIGIYHAGQVVRKARQVLPFQLRGADTVVVFQAVMVLWAWGMVVREAERREARMASGREIVFLDDEEGVEKVDGWLILGHGRPCLHLEGKTGVCDLRFSQAVMSMGIKVFEGNYPNETRSNLPQLTRSLCELMGELGSLK